MNIDPILTFLRMRGEGSWSVFRSAVEAFDASLDTYSLARGLSEHALVEFDFTNGRSWSTTSACLVNAPMTTGGFATGAWGGSIQSVERAGLKILPGSRTIHTWSGSVVYSHALRVQKPDGGWPRSWQPTDARDLRPLLPSLNRIHGLAPVVEPRRIKERLCFRFRSVSQTKENKAKKWVEAKWMTAGQPNYSEEALWRSRIGERLIFSSGGVCRQVDSDVGRWLAFRSWLNRNGIESGLSYDEDRSILSISAQPALPVPYVRSLLLNGAREDGLIGERIRVFRNVDRPLCDWFVGLLNLPPL